MGSPEHHASWKSWAAGIGAIAGLITAITGLIQVLAPKETGDRGAAAANAPATDRGGATAQPAANGVTTASLQPSARPEPALADPAGAPPSQPSTPSPATPPECSRGYFLQTASGYREGHNFEQTEEAVRGNPALSGSCFVELSTESGQPVFGALVQSLDQVKQVKALVQGFGAHPAETSTFKDTVVPKRRLFWVTPDGTTTRRW